MPNRIIKESICTSDTIDQLTAEEERFFYRLIVQADDFGRFDGRAPVVLAGTFPLRAHEIGLDQVEAWLQRLAEVDLIRFYHIDGRRYLYFTTWDKHQQKRAKYSKYPDPTEDDGACEDVITTDITCKHTISNDSICPRETRSENTRNEKREKNVVPLGPTSSDDRPEPKFDEGSTPYQLALHLRAAILMRDQETKVPDETPAALERWATEADRMIRIDERDPHEAAELMTWAQQDPFWSTNILSMAAFRKQYDRLKRQSQRPARADPRASPGHMTYLERELREAGVL